MPLFRGPHLLTYDGANSRTRRVRPVVLYRFGHFELDTDEFCLSKAGLSVPLEPKALLLLSYLVSHSGRLLRKQELLDAVWSDATVSENALTRAITILRRALEDSSRAPQFIETVPKVGYRFVAEVNSGPDKPANPDSPAMPVLPAEPELTVTAEQQHAPGISLPAGLPPGSRWPVRRRWAAGLAAGSLALFGLIGSRYFKHALVGTSRFAEPAKGLAGQNNTPTSDREAAREEIRRGLFFYDKRNGPASEAAFRHAIELDPQSSSAHAGLAQALLTQAILSQSTAPDIVSKAEGEGREAVRLDPQNADAHIALGTVQAVLTWEWKEAESNFKSGLQIDPRNALGNMWYATYLDAAGQPEKAIERVRMAVDADPLSFFMLRQQASILYFGHRYDEALRVLDRAREMSPSQTDILDNWLSWIDEQRGLYGDAVEHDLSRQRARLTAKELADLRNAYRAGGWNAYWTVRLNQMHSKRQAGCGLYAAGRAYLRLGNRDEAFEALREAARQHCFWLSQLAVDPGLQDFRQDPRFPQLVAIVDPRHELAQNR